MPLRLVDDDNLEKQVSASLLENGTHKKDESSYETAVEATGFGKFNYLLILAFIPFTCCQIFESNSITYVVPVAQCDLNLSLEGKGQLIAASYTGMVLGGFIWGYLSDRYGRKTIMIAGFFIHWICMLLASASQSFIMLMIFKFLGGLVVNGPYSASSAMLSEYHSSENRARIQLARGVLSSMAHIALPILGWGVLPRNLDFTLFGYLEFHSWNVYLFICSLAPLTSVILIMIMSESPKFLMSMNKNEEALAVFRTMYRLNTGKPSHTYPIKYLVQEMELKQCMKEEMVQSPHRRVWADIKPLFRPPFLKKLLLSCLNSFLVLSSTNTVRLWQPQLLQAVSDYQHLHNGSSASMCDMLAILTPKKKNITTCTVNLDNASVYLGSISVKTALLVTFATVAIIVKYVGKKLLLGILASVAGIFAISIYFIQSSSVLVVILAVFVSCSSVSLHVSEAITLELFPTHYRTKAISLFWVTARFGTIVGNILFPPLLQAGCLPPFLFVAVTIFGTAGMSFLFPSTKNNPLS